MIKAVRGTRDILPPDTALWNFVEAAVRDVFRAYNFQEIRTPIFEATELFARGVGEETDIVSKEMFTWDDGGGSIDMEIQQRWISRHVKEGWADLVPYARPGRKRALAPTLLAFSSLEKPEAKIVRSKYLPGLQDISELLEIGRNYESERPGEPPAKLLLVTIGGLISTEVRMLAIRAQIEIEELDNDTFELPQYLTLRPEATAGIVRAYIEHKLWDRGLNKLFCIGPMFRRERPQKGRYRQFYQIDAEIIGPTASGSESPARDAEILEMLATLLDRLGIIDWNLELNSVGSSQERVKFNEALRVALEPVKDKMCVDCQRRAVTNPLRVLDCKVPEDQPIIETLPRITDFLEEDSKKHFAAVQVILTKVGVPFTLNSRLVRGLDYYTRTAFEFTHGALGAQNAILGGGRYDGLSEALGGPSAPGIGFAIGEDRLIMTLAEKTSPESVLRKPDAYIAPLGQTKDGAGMNAEAALLARELRRHDLTIELGDESFRLKKSFEAADKAGAKYIVIVGENEVKADAFTVKNLATGEQVQVARAELAVKLQER